MKRKTARSKILKKLLSWNSLYVAAALQWYVLTQEVKDHLEEVLCNPTTKTKDVNIKLEKCKGPNMAGTGEFDQVPLEWIMASLLTLSKKALKGANHELAN